MSKWRFLLGICAALLLPVSAAHAVSQGPGLLFDERNHADGPQPDAEETGTIADVNPDSHSIVLADGHRYKIPHWINFDRLQKGEMISIVYTPNPHHNTTAVKTVTVI